MTKLFGRMPTNNEFQPGIHLQESQTQFALLIGVLLFSHSTLISWSKLGLNPSRFQVVVLWVMMPCSGAVGYQRFEGPPYIHLHHYTASQRRARLESSLPWKPQISHFSRVTV